MTQPQLKSVQCVSPGGLHTMAYKEWGDPHNPKVVVCVHGVTRVSDDFDALATDLARDYRVICPDVVGRGRSGTLRDPVYYGLPQYVSDMVTLIARLDVAQVDWVGTSMGGLIGILLGGLEGAPIKRMVINDVGPRLDAAAITRIGNYIGTGMRFDTREEAIAYVRAISAPFGPHSEDQWTKLAHDVLRQDEDGKWVRNYDLRLAVPFKSVTPQQAAAGEAALWRSWDALACEVLLLRGALSDLLSAETAREMVERRSKRGGQARLVEFEGVGHAPTLMQPDQIEAITAFLGR